MLISIPHICHVFHTYTDLSGSESPTDTPTTVGDGSTLPNETQSSSTSPPAAKRPALSCTRDCGDVASFVGTRIVNADERYNFLNNHFKPAADYTSRRNPRRMQMVDILSAGSD